MSPLLVFASVFVCTMCALGFYALYKKGDVRIHFSRGKTCFELDAKDRLSK